MYEYSKSILHNVYIHVVKSADMFAVDSSEPDTPPPLNQLSATLGW